MSLRLGDTVPDFTQVSNIGDISFYEWAGDSWVVFFSYPADYSPVCTTELGEVAKLQSEFDKRNVKAIALGVNDIESHLGWIKDIEETQITSLNYPILADVDKTVSNLYNLIDPNADAKVTVRSVFIIDPNKKLRLTITYPCSIGRNFEEILRVIDSLQLTDKYSVATPVNWKEGDDVVVTPAITTEKVKEKFLKTVTKIKPRRTATRIKPQTVTQNKTYLRTLMGEDISFEVADGLIECQLDYNFPDDDSRSLFDTTKEEDSGKYINLNQTNLVLLRYPYLECPQSSLINQRFSLYVQILIKSPKPEIKVIEIEDTGISDQLPEVEIVLRARGFDIEGTNTRIIEIERDDDTEERFVLIPRKLGEQQIRVDFYQNGKRIGTARRNMMINAELSSATIEISQSKDQPSLEFRNDFSVPPPDLELCVELDGNNNRTLYFTLHSTKSEIDYHHTKVGQKTLETAPEEKIKSVSQELGHLAESLSRKGTPIDLDSEESNFKDARRKAEERLVSVGNQLWDELIPDKLKQEYWKFRYQIKSLLITSDEPWIPWEMIKPYDLDEDLEAPFWCDQFAMSRWLSGPGTADEFPAGLVVTVAPDNSNLPNVIKEVDFLQHLNNFKSSFFSAPIIISGLKLKKFIKKNEFSILHFACHGIFNRNLPNDSSIKLSGDFLHPSDIHIKFEKVRPIIFINACHGGRVGFSFTKIGGWAEKFVNARVGVFIGAMWEVNDELAFQFAETFYTGLLQDNLTVAEAFQKSRQTIRDTAPYNSTWLAYSLYADPEARIQQAN